MKKSGFILLLGIMLLSACQKKQSVSRNNEYPDFSIDSTYFANGFILERHSDFKVIHLINPWNKEQTLQTYILCSDSKPLPDHLPKGEIIRTPLKRTVVFSSVICGFLEELDVLHTLTGVAEPEYIDLPYIKHGIETGKIEDIGQASNPHIEKLILINPDALFTNPISDSENTSLNKQPAPIIHCFEYMESDPLGQAEWIRFYGWLFEKEELADSLFRQTLNHYNQLKELTDHVKYRPSVFAELKLGDFWYMPGGKSYMANLFSDAGADYILKENDHSGSVSLHFETVLDKAEDADFWLFKYYSPYNMTYEQLQSDYSNYGLFKAFKERKIYACNTLQTANYYRELPLHPDWILRDFISIFHPELLPNHQPRYYNKLTK
ncbi:MAG: ABC transporter substrate-binding protein [Dysgonamonadaceae bacterium]|jgi:iron complex transport system substrate-binding protein|nr:ABC transporter substrate-binding protein [Dysgonamonadaceae bacterium]